MSEPDENTREKGGARALTVEQVNARLDGCEHAQVRLVSPTFPGGDSFWSCLACGQRFCPLLTEPVLVGDWGKPRLADASNPEWSRP